MITIKRLISFIVLAKISIYAELEEAPLNNLTMYELSGKGFTPPNFKNQSQYAYLDEKSGKLIYQPMDIYQNRIPDYSTAGYQGGGVKIPIIEVVEVISPRLNTSLDPEFISEENLKKHDGSYTPSIYDDTSRIQEAIDRVSQRPLDENGFRGVVWLKKGRYRIEGNLTIRASGVVIRGSGRSKNGTVLYSPILPNTHKIGKIPAHMLPGYMIDIDVPDTSKKKSQKYPLIKITDDYVPIGTRSFHVADINGLKVGDTILIEANANGRCREALRTGPIWMDLADGSKMAKTDDVAKSIKLVQHKTWITDINSKENRITIHHTTFHSIAKVYGGGTIKKISKPDMKGNIGVENMRLVSEWKPIEHTWQKKVGKPIYDDDLGWRWIEQDGTVNRTEDMTTMIDAQNHRGKAILLKNIENSWVRDITTENFIFCSYMIQGRQITVQDCSALLPENHFYDYTNYVARYAFHNSGEDVLIQRCSSKNARHQFNMGAGKGTARVVVDCIGGGSAHHGYQSGILFDHVRGAVESNSRGGNNWRDMNTTFWNCGAETLLVDNAPMAYPPVGYKWAIGCYYSPASVGDHQRSEAEIREFNRTKGPLFPGKGPAMGNGVWDSYGEMVFPRSLYFQQLQDRLGWEAAYNVKSQVNWPVEIDKSEALVAEYAEKLSSEDLTELSKDWTLVAKDNCGKVGAQPNLVKVPWNFMKDSSAGAKVSDIYRTKIRTSYTKGLQAEFKYEGLSQNGEYILIVHSFNRKPLSCRVEVNGMDYYIKSGKSLDKTISKLILPKRIVSQGHLSVVFDTIGGERFFPIHGLELWKK